MRRTMRPNSSRLLVLIALVLSFVIWLGLELGRSRTYRIVAVLASGLTLAFFALGWTAR